MKLRHCFVSNSSSSSFVLNRNMCTPEQLEALKNHIEYADAHFFDFYTGEFDRWELTEKGCEIRGFTWMDNFDMREFIEKIGIPSDAVKFEREHSK